MLHLKLENCIRNRKQVTNDPHHSPEQHFKKYTILHVANAKNGPVALKKKEDEIASLHTDGRTDGQQKLFSLKVSIV